MEDDAEVKKAVDKVQGVYDVHGKREWVEWAGKMLMLRLHVQMVMEQVDVMRAEQDTIDEEQIQAERAEHEEERAAKEAELDEKEEEYIWQMNAKEINEGKFWELVNELDLERAMAASVAEGLATTQATTQDEEVGESEREESAEEEPVAVEAVVESSMVRKGKHKAAPPRAKVYTEMDEPVIIYTQHKPWNAPKASIMQR
jgi:hypothetical protein